MARKAAKGVTERRFAILAGCHVPHGRGVCHIKPVGDVSHTGTKTPSEVHRTPDGGH